MSSPLDPEIVAYFRKATPPYLGTSYVRLTQSIRDEAVADLTAERDSLRKKSERLDERHHELHDLLTAVKAERDRLRAVVEQALNLGEDEGMQRGKTPYPDWWVLLDRALDPRHRPDGSAEATDA